jgi:hypothetical protein
MGSPELVSSAESGLRRYADILNRRLVEADRDIGSRYEPLSSSDDKFRIANVSLLFNRPLTGGGIVHTAELAGYRRPLGVRLLRRHA